MRRGFPYGTSITCKKEGKIYVEGRILRSVTMSGDSVPCVIPASLCLLSLPHLHTNFTGTTGTARILRISP